MTDNYENNGYLFTIRKGLDYVRTLKDGLVCGGSAGDEDLRWLKLTIQQADAVVIGAGAGLSTAAGMTYSGERFDYYFSDFAKRFHIEDMYSGGFYPFPDEETRWAWWARQIYCNRYMDAPRPVYRDLLDLISGKDYFVITTNVDHLFQKNGFDKKRLFYTQGDYGLFQSTNPRVEKTFDNEEWVMQAMEAQGFVKDNRGQFQVPEHGRLEMRLSSCLIPRTPTGGEVTTNLRADEFFVEDAGWRRSSKAYLDFLNRVAEGRVLFLEIGVGSNTPVIIKYPFWAMTSENPMATYACLNYEEPTCPASIEPMSLLLKGDAGYMLSRMTQME